MTTGARRRRALLLLSLALACGGLAASAVGSRVREVDGRVGRPVPVLVAARGLKAGRDLRRADLALRQVPARFVPPDALRSADEAVGAAPSAPLTRGAYLTAAALAGAQEDGGRAGGLRRGERAVEVDVAGGTPLSQSSGPGSRVDVVVSTEPRTGSGRTFLALENVELLAVNGSGGAAGSGGARSTGDDGAGAAGRASATATLRVTLRQAVYLTAAENFAREVRLLPRPGGDQGRAGRAAVSAGGL